MYLKQLTPPTGYAISLAEARRQLRILEGDTEDDAELNSLIARATSYVEGDRGRDGHLGRALLTQTFEFRRDFFPLDPNERIRLPMPPLQSVQYIRYIDSDGAVQTVDPAMYVVDEVSTPGEIYLAYAGFWPSARWERHAVRIGFTAGYGAASAVPEVVKHAMLMLISHWWSHRDAASPERADPTAFGVDALLANARIRGF